MPADVTDSCRRHIDFLPLDCQKLDQKAKRSGLLHIRADFRIDWSFQSVFAFRLHLLLGWKETNYTSKRKSFLMLQRRVACTFILQHETIIPPRSHINDSPSSSRYRDRVFKLNLKNVTLTGCEVSNSGNNGS